MATRPALTWDLFCRVIDNHGDIGVCWRLARRLATLGQRVRLWIDDARALAWMAPDGDRHVHVLPWREPQPGDAPGDVVVEAFGCDPPPGFVARMAAATQAPVWINLEYLSAEAYVARSHLLPSPQQRGPGAGLVKWFFYPGFGADTGGLLYEDDLTAERAGFDLPSWLASVGVQPHPGARRVSLFCYAQPALAAWLAHWQEQPTQLLVTPGPAAEQVGALLGAPLPPGSVLKRGALHAHALPWLSQDGFDRLLWSCDLNHVRGEDSLVRALWSGQPFVWQLYPQADGAHAAKLEAFLALYLHGADPALAQALRGRFRQWNGLDPARAEAGPAPPAWRVHAHARRAAFESEQRGLGDLGSRLYRFVVSKR
ncbi:MAG TPA: elongation factor P maturation arginine rhamnosyltransferase EarP [Methylibium sp.]|nr:elongation factor P maturation arginine rhamnosyltransferase EarP [Methylibium sp.]